MNYWIYIQCFICLSICLYLKGDTKMTQICLTSSASLTGLSTTLAVPQLVRRKPSGRYTVRYRQRGSMIPMLSLGLKTTNRNEAINRMTTITEAAKLFLLDNPKATPKEFNERLKDVAEALLTDDARSYWSHEGDIDTLGDLTGALRSLSLGQLSVAHQVAIRNALEVLQAGSERVQHGDPSALIGVLEGLKGLKDDGDIANNVITNSKDPKATWASIVEDCLAEKRLTIRESSVKDLESSLRTVSKYILESDFMSRQVWLSVRDAMLADGLAISSVNKFLTKARMVIEYALMNQKVPLGRNPIERIKMREPQGKRKAFSEEQLKALVVASRHLMEPHRRSLVALGAITGARIGELVQLTPSDVVTIDGTVYIDINDNDAKTLKNANSKRLVPLCDGLYGFSLADFMEDVKSLTSTDSTASTTSTICKVTRDRASKWFNEEFVKATLGDVEGLVFHSFRHAMATQCKAHGVSEVDAGSILGHKSQSITYGLYGKGQALGRLKGAMETLKDGHS